MHAGSLYWATSNSMHAGRVLKRPVWSLQLVSTGTYHVLISSCVFLLRESGMAKGPFSVCSMCLHVQAVLQVVCRDGFCLSKSISCGNSGQRDYSFPQHEPTGNIFNDTVSHGRALQKKKNVKQQNPRFNDNIPRIAT